MYLSIQVRIETLTYKGYKSKKYLRVGKKSKQILQRKKKLIYIYKIY